MRSIRTPSGHTAPHGCEHQWELSRRLWWIDNKEIGSLIHRISVPDDKTSLFFVMLIVHSDQLQEGVRLLIKELLTSPAQLPRPVPWPVLLLGFRWKATAHEFPAASTTTLPGSWLETKTHAANMLFDTWLSMLMCHTVVANPRHNLEMQSDICAIWFLRMLWNGAQHTKHTHTLFLKKRREESKPFSSFIGQRWSMTTTQNQSQHVSYGSRTYGSRTAEANFSDCFCCSACTCSMKPPTPCAQTPVPPSLRYDFYVLSQVSEQRDARFKSLRFW